MRPLSVTLTPGLPADGDRGEFIGRDAHGNTFLLRWHSRNGWLALGWEGAGDAGWPIRHALTGEKQGLIKGHVEIAGSGGDAGPEGAAVKNGTRPEDRHPAGVRALGGNVAAGNLDEVLASLFAEVMRYGQRLLSDAEAAADAGQGQEQFAATAGAAVISNVLDLIAKRRAGAGFHPISKKLMQ